MWSSPLHTAPPPLPLCFPGVSDGNHLSCGRPWFHIWVGRSPGEGNSYPLQYSGLENPTAEEPSRLHTVHGVTKNQTQLSDFHFHCHTICFSMSLPNHLVWGFCFLPLFFISPPGLWTHHDTYQHCIESTYVCSQPFPGNHVRILDLTLISHCLGHFFLVRLHQQVYGNKHHGRYTIYHWSSNKSDTNNNQENSHVTDDTWE